MFIDGITGEVVGPRISPVMVVLETRNQTYYNMVEDAETGEIHEVVSTGHEIVKEVPTKPATPVVTLEAGKGDSYWRGVAETVAEHARRCKKQLTSECPTCLTNIKKMAQVPLHVLSEVLR